MKAKAFWVISLLLATFFPSHARAQLTGPLPGANIGDFVDLPMLVKPAVLAILPGGTQVLLSDQGRLKILDLSTHRVQLTPVLGLSAARIAIEGSGPTALVIEPSDLVRVDYVTGQKTVLATGIANGTGLAIEPGGQTALVCDGAGISRVALSTGSITNLASVAAGDVAVEPSGTSALFTPGSNGSTIFRIDLTTNTVAAAATLPSPLRGSAIEVAADGSFALVISSGSDTGIVRIDLTTGATNQVIDSGIPPFGGFAISDIALSGDSSKLVYLMTTPDDPLVASYDFSNGSGDFVTGLTPYSLATEGGGTVLLTSIGGVFGSLYRLDIASGLSTKILGHFPGADISVLPSGTQALLCWPSFSGIPGDLIQVDLGAINRFVYIAQRLGASAVAAEANGTTALVIIGNALGRVDLATGNVATITQAMNGPVGVASDDSGENALVGSLSGIYRVRLSDGLVALLTATAATFVAVEPGAGTAIFAVGGGLNRIDLTSGAETVLVSGIPVDGKVVVEAGDATALVATTEGIKRVRIRTGSVPPTITSISPVSGTQGQTIPTFTVNGSNFDSAAKLSFNSGNGIVINSQSVIGTSQITANLTITIGAPVGTQDVIVTNSDGQKGTLPGGFTVLAPPPPPPTVLSVSPTSGIQGANIPNFTVNGSNFDSAAKLSFNSGNGIVINSQSVIGTTQITANITIASNAPLGAQDVVVTNSDGQKGTLPSGFTVSPPPTGTITVTTNTASATFTITGPMTYFGSGTSATFTNAPIGDYKIKYGPSCRSDLPQSQTETLIAGGSIVFVGTYTPGFLSNFPLSGLDPCSATVSAVFDHSQTAPYHNGGTVTAYTNESGKCDINNQNQQCRSKVNKTGHFGFPNIDGIPFLVNGNYSGGGGQCTAQACNSSKKLGSKSCSTFLFYEGHPGFDYPASCSTPTPVYAAVSGTVYYPPSVPGIGANGATFHVLEIDPLTPNTMYKVYYLHLSNYTTNNCTPAGLPVNCTCPFIANVKNAGDPVAAGELIGYVGDAGVPGPPHLHFEVQILGRKPNKAGIPVDPYGWKSTATDPYIKNRGVTNLNLWK
jgi:hypothetical protein